MQDKHGADLHYKMVVVVAPCETGIVAILSTCIYKMVLVVAPCDRHGDLNYKMVVASCDTGKVVILTIRWCWCWLPAGQTL